MHLKYYFVTHKNVTIDDIVRFTGISISNFWFEFFLNIFSKHCKEINSYPDLIKIIGRNKEHTIRLLNDDYAINGEKFDMLKAFLFEIDSSIFSNVSFKLIKSRKIIVINDDEFNTMQY